MKIGYIGLGSLGTPLAENLLQSGHELYVYNRTASKTKPLADKGAKVSATIADLAKECDIVFTMVSDDAALNAVSAELLQHLRKGSLHISMTTILPQTAADLHAAHAAKGLHYLPSPVFGRPEAARARKMNFVLSGSAELKKKAEPLCRDAGAMNVWDFGEDIKAANTVKLCGNFITAAAIEAIGESIALAERSGVDAKRMWELFSANMHNSPTYVSYSKIISERKFEPASFTIRLGLKDLNLILAQAKEAGQRMPLAEVIQQNMKKIVDEGKGELDWSAVAEANRE
jgi:3-hydroxyisobutyrate dehydrogenase-like beta-hydroxyacid dehydrogenase